MATVKVRKFTPRLEDTLAFVKAYTADKGISPTRQEIAQHFGISAPAAHYRLHRLAAFGKIDMTDRLARSITLPSA